MNSTNVALRLLALLNNGPNHEFSLEIEKLPTSDSLESSLNAYYTAIVNWRTKMTYPAEDWHIKTELLTGRVQDVFGPVLKRWAFEMPYSPVINSSRDWVKNAAIEFVCETLAQEVGDVAVYEVKTRPPVWYEAHWQDFALSSDQGRFLLHLGVTD